MMAVTTEYDNNNVKWTQSNYINVIPGSVKTYQNKWNQNIGRHFTLEKAAVIIARLFIHYPYSHNRRKVPAFAFSQVYLCIHLCLKMINCFFLCYILIKELPDSFNNK